MFTSDPLSGVLAAVATGAVLGLLLALYRQHREPFLFWAVVAWAATLAQLVADIPRELAWQRLVWAFGAALALAIKSLAFLAAGLAYRRPALVSRLRVLVGVAVAIGLAGLQTAWLPLLPATIPGLRELPITLAHAVAILAAGAAFWPQHTVPTRTAAPAAPPTLARVLASPLLALVHHARGVRLLAVSLLAWGALQIGFLVPLPELAGPALLRVAGFLQGVQSVALVMLVLDRARQRAEFLRSFNQTLLDAMDTGLALLDRDLKIQHARRRARGRRAHLPSLSHDQAARRRSGARDRARDRPGARRHPHLPQPAWRRVLRDDAAGSR